MTRTLYFKGRKPVPAVRAHLLNLIIQDLRYEELWTLAYGLNRNNEPVFTSPITSGFRAGDTFPTLQVYGVHGVMYPLYLSFRVDAVRAAIREIARTGGTPITSGEMVSPVAEAERLASELARPAVFVTLPEGRQWIPLRPALNEALTGLVDEGILEADEIRDKKYRNCWTSMLGIPMEADQWRTRASRGLLGPAEAWHTFGVSGWSADTASHSAATFNLEV